MSPTFLLSVTLLVPAAPVPKDAVPPTTGPAPRVAVAHHDRNQENQLRIYGSIPVKVLSNEVVTVIEEGKEVQKQRLKEIVTYEDKGIPLARRKATYSTADGKALTLDEALARLKDGTTLLISADGKPVAKSWLRAVRDDTVVMVEEGLWHFRPIWGDPPFPSTPAPRLTILGTDERGRVVAPVTTHPSHDPHGAYDDGSIFQGAADGPGWRNRAIIDYERLTPPPAPGAEKVVQKPLANIKFTAFDLKGKAVAKEDVLKRLGAGGLALVAASSRMPDERYLKGFRDDVLVLLSAELLLPVEPLDRTGRKQAPKK